MQQELTTIIRRSCLTDKVVWLYRGHGTKRYIDKEYCVACRRERERIKRWSRTMTRRRKRINDLLSTLTAELPIMGTLSAEQRQAIRELQSIATQDLLPDRAFYEHFLESRRQRKKACKWRQHNRELEARWQAEHDGMTYGQWRRQQRQDKKSRIS